MVTKISNVTQQKIIADLQYRLQEAEDTLEAIRNGAVDALVVKSRNEQEVFTLRSADYTYRMLIESMNQGALTMNFNGTILYSNKQFSDMLAQPLEKVIGNSILDFIANEHQPIIQSLLDGEQGKDVNLEVNLRSADNTRLTVIVSVTTLTQPDVKPYLCVVITDMTERKQAEEAKDEFISLASHQLRTPATSVKQYVNMVLDGLFGEIGSSQRDALERANASNERELKIIEDLLRVAQIDAGKIVLNRSLADISSLVADVVNERAAQISARNQAIKCLLPATAAKAYVDETLFHMVIENLLDNASKYMAEKGTITVDVESGNDVTTISIADTGVGMSQQDISKLFQKFMRLPNELSIKVGGNGLGLYWVKKVVDLHAATIMVTSAVGKGTTFVITLPQGESGAKYPSRR